MILLIMLLAYAGALLGVIVGWGREEQLLWLAIGSLVGILVGAVLALTLAQRTGTPATSPNSPAGSTAPPPPQPAPPPPPSQPPPGANPKIGELELTVSQVPAQSYIPLDLSLYVVYADTLAGANPAAVSGSDGQLASSPPSEKLVRAAVASAVHQVLSQRNLVEIEHAEQNGTLARDIRDVAKPIMDGWDYELCQLVVVAAQQPQSLIEAGMAEQIQARNSALNANLSHKVMIAAYSDLQKTMLEAYKTGQAGNLKTGRLCRAVLTATLQDVKAATEPEGIWSKELSQLLAKLETDTSVGT